MDGLLLIDKPIGVTSHDVVRVVRRAAGTRKVGHTGTLDPRATGLLPLTLGTCTKLAKYLLLDRKTYHFEARFGQRTAGGDAEGEIIEECPWEYITLADMEEALETFRGEIMQRPPRYSAVRVGGKRAYELARAGVDFELAERPVTVESLEVVGEPEWPDVRFVMRCGSGTYVRAIVRDLGWHLDSCAYTTMIRRTEVGRFSIDQAVSLEALQREEVAVEDVLLPPVEMMGGLHIIYADEGQLEDVGHGRMVRAVLSDAEESDHVAILDSDGGLAAIAEVLNRHGEEVVMRPRRVLQTRSG